ncbi:MAG: FAD-dependent oxidoreductase [Trueperaceae bacterium]|nr:FAD-dependent oxidoreductase [Trueperaceae bacterium]
MVDFLLIGAGIAGLTAARQLSSAYSVVVLEKSRGLGGRSATRRLEGNRVDHGAQYFTVRDERFQEQVNEWLGQDKAFVWSHGFHTYSQQGLKPATKGHPRYTLRNGMNEVGKLLSEGLEVKTQTRAHKISKQKDYYLVETEEGQAFEAKRVIVNAPAEQALALLEPSKNELQDKLASVKMVPCFALMPGYPLQLAPEWQGIHVETESSLAWISHDSSKRLNPAHTVLTLHSTPEFAQVHFDVNPDELAQTMLTDLGKIDDRFTAPLFSSWHRWKYAQVSNSLEERFLNVEDSLFFCGDWCGGAKLESAYLSGLELGQYLLTLKP